MALGLNVEAMKAGKSRCKADLIQWLKWVEEMVPLMLSAGMTREFWTSFGRSGMLQ